MGREIKHICYADDDTDDHFIFSEALNQVDKNITLSLFESCESLCTLLEDGQSPLPDLIFLDLNMPGNENRDCLRQIKKMPHAMNIPVIIYSTSATFRNSNGNALCIQVYSETSQF